MAERASARTKAVHGHKSKKSVRQRRQGKNAPTASRPARKRAVPAPKTSPPLAAVPLARTEHQAHAVGKARGTYTQLVRDRRALRIASIILGIIALLHLIRFVTGFTLIVDDVVLPITASGFIVVIFGILAVWYYRLSLD